MIRPISRRRPHRIQRYRFERDTGDDDHRAGCRQTADIGQQRQPRRALGQHHPEHVIVGIDVQRQALTGPQDHRDCDVQQQQEGRERPGRRAYAAHIEILGEQHVELTWQQERRGERQEHQRRPRALVDRSIQCLDRLRMDLEPGRQAARAIEYVEQGIAADDQQHHQLDQRFESDGDDQAAVFLPWRDMPRAEQHAEQDQRGTEHQRDGVRWHLVTQHAQRFGHRPYLQRDVGQRADKGKQRHQQAGRLAAVTERQQVGQRSQLVFAAQLEDRSQQERAENKSQRRAEIDR